MPLLAQVEGPVVEAFRRGGGVPYSAYREFHAVMADESAKVADAALVDAVLPLVDGMPERLTKGIDVADVGCGSGHAVNVMAQAYPASRFVGYDFSEGRSRRPAPKPRRSVRATSASRSPTSQRWRTRRRST